MSTAYINDLRKRKMKVPCPACGAVEGEMCRGANGHTLGMHVDRATAAKKAGFMEATKGGRLWKEQTMASKKVEAKKVSVTKWSGQGSETGANEIAEAIEKIADAARELLNSRLTERALLLLLSDASGQPMKTCKAVLEGARDLKKFVRR